MSGPYEDSKLTSSRGFNDRIRAAINGTTLQSLSVNGGSSADSRGTWYDKKTPATFKRTLLNLDLMSEKQHKWTDKQKLIHFELMNKKVSELIDIN